MGALSGLLVRRERLVLVDDEPLCIPVLQQRFGGRDNVRIEQGQLTAADFERWQEEQIDTVVCSRLLEGQEADERALKRIFDFLPPGGHCVLLLPAGDPSAPEPSSPPPGSRMAAAIRSGPGWRSVDRGRFRRGLFAAVRQARASLRRTAQSASGLSCRSFLAARPFGRLVAAVFRPNALGRWPQARSRVATRRGVIWSAGFYSGFLP